MNNAEDDPRLFNREIDPVKQGAAVVASIPVFNLLFMIPDWIGFAELPDYHPWALTIGMVLLFAVFNTILSLGADNVTRYWSRSIYSFIGVCILGGLMAWAFSGMPISGNPSIKWLYFVMTFVYLLFLSIINIMRKLVGIAQRVDKDLRGEAD